MGKLSSLKMASTYAALVLLCGLTVHATAGSMPSEYVRCRNFMDGIDQMEEDDSVSSELEKGNPDFVQTKSYCEAILKQKRHNDVEDNSADRCKISLFSQDNFEGDEENFEEDRASIRVKA